MFYRITLDLSFTERAAVDDILDKVKDHRDKATTINPSGDAEERGFIIVEKHYHDEDPTKDCEVLHEWHTK